MEKATEPKADESSASGVRNLVFGGSLQPVGVARAVGTLLAAGRETSGLGTDDVAALVDLSDRLDALAGERAVDFASVAGEYRNDVAFAATALRRSFLYGNPESAVHSLTLWASRLAAADERRDVAAGLGRIQTAFAGASGMVVGIEGVQHLPRDPRTAPYELDVTAAERAAVGRGLAAYARLGVQEEDLFRDGTSFAAIRRFAEANFGEAPEFREAAFGSEEAREIDQTRATLGFAFDQVGVYGAEAGSARSAYASAAAEMLESVVARSLCRDGIRRSADGERSAGSSLVLLAEVFGRASWYAHDRPLNETMAWMDGSYEFEGSATARERSDSFER